MSPDFWAGYISGAAGIIVGNPLDVIKVRIQAGLQSRPSLDTGATESTSLLRASATQPQSTRTPVKSLLRGLPAPILTYGALNALLFTTYNRSLLLSAHLTTPRGSLIDVPNQDGRYPYWNHFAAGCAAGIATFIISAPTEVIKCRAQVSQDASGTVNSSWSILKTLYHAEGVRGLYHGGVITSIRDSVGYGFYFVAYEGAKDAWDTIVRLQHDDLYAGHSILGKVGGNEAFKTLICGGLAGVVSWLSIFPLDMVKTRVQLSNNEGAWSVARNAFRAEGVSVFFKGATICCIRAFIVNAVQWSVYEYVMANLTKG